MDFLIAKRVPFWSKTFLFVFLRFLWKVSAPQNDFSVYEDLFSSFIDYLMPIVLRMCEKEPVFYKSTLAFCFLYLWVDWLRTRYDCHEKLYQVHTACSWSSSWAGPSWQRRDSRQQGQHKGSTTKPSLNTFVNANLFWFTKKTPHPPLDDAFCFLILPIDNPWETI